MPRQNILHEQILNAAAASFFQQFCDMKIICMALTVLLMTSCSIKQDRSGCPSLLRLDFSAEKKAAPDAELLLSVNCRGKCLLADTVRLGEISGLYDVEVPKDLLNVNVWSEDASRFVSGGSLFIPLGDDCPAVDMFSQTVDLSGAETKTLPVELSKNYCVLDITFKDEGIDDFVVDIEGDIDGYSEKGLPRKGDFFHFLDSPMKLLLPRQTEATLKLDIWKGHELLKTFALGNYMEKGGYDWAAKNLKDASVTIDFACTTVNIVVGEWDNTSDFDIVF